MIRKIFLALGLLVVAVGGFLVYEIGGPKNVIGMLRYDQRHAGRLKVGDAAPDVRLTALDGKTAVRLHDRLGAKPLVIVFGSYT
ncbi:MAG TPA: hypothetical protein VOA87_11490 [Thermoanaerobaculia bacterium]|nr:hypothetical protein [Thermoanaerobaculia bacterium]